DGRHPGRVEPGPGRHKYARAVPRGPRRATMRSGDTESRQNGHGMVPVPTEEWQRIDQAYRELQRRDGRAEERAWRWERFALTELAVLLALLGLVVWGLLAQRHVQAFVQVVQVDAQGQLIQVGVPQDLLAYTPAEGLWMDLLGEWVRRMRW